MGHSQAEKAQNRERILAEAARQIREGGLESVSVAQLMKSVDLTHGGFYGHFESRSELISLALERALAESRAAIRAAKDAAEPPSFAGMVGRYLSRTHRDSRHSGCAIAALAADVGRADAASREVMQERIESFFETAGNALGQGDEDKAILAVCAMVGGLTLARVMTDTQRSDAVLRAVREQLLKLQADPG
jgi:TetR/AcrR family transcriptional repressor of nem operon